ncbi:MAG: hypothetical protein KC620_13040, partial [Myxococcales bacterium]|nr:hypothetical protein [Myxococcales bacterium]
MVLVLLVALGAGCDDGDNAVVDAARDPEPMADARPADARVGDLGQGDAAVHDGAPPDGPRVDAT